MKKNRILCRITVLLLAVCILFSGCSGLSGLFSNDTITVAVYPYIPDMDLFRDILTRQWEEIEPDVELEWVNWDCYTTPEPGKIDVMMYDAMFTTYLAENNFIQPIPEDSLADREGFVPFAVDGAYHNGQLYGVPYLVCSFFLIHHADDAEMAAVENMVQLCELAQARMEQDPSQGLLLNYDSDYPYHYIDALMDYNGSYTMYDEAPSTNPRDPVVYDLLCQMKASRAVEPENDGMEDLGAFRRGALFNKGIGSAYYGYSEDLSFMDDILDQVTIRTIPFCDAGNIQLFAADNVSMGAHVKNADKKEACIKLMNLIGSDAFLEELCFATGDAQYMLPARQNVYLQAQERFPMYARLYELAMDENNRVIRFGKSVHEYLANAYGDLE